MKLGSLCTGYGGLDAAAESAFGAETVWHAELDSAASLVLAAHWPGVPNHGDIRSVDWAGVEPVDILTAGFPCQDLSLAGAREGLVEGNRSGLWFEVARAISVLRPSVVVIENVEGILSARADSDMEPCPWCVGQRGGDPVPALRALGAVLGDLAGLGFNADWTTVAASDVGAPHRRRRVFVVAYPADSESVGHGYCGSAGGNGLAAAAVGDGVAADGMTLLPTPAARLGDRWGAPSAETAARRMDGEHRRNLEDAVALLPTPAARDAGRGFGWGDQPGRPLSETIARLLPTPTVSDSGSGPGHSGREGSPNLRTEVTLLPTPRATDGTKGGPNQRCSSGNLMLPSAVMDVGRWGQYAPAIARWEQVLGRSAPAPTEPGVKGQPRLSPRFVEWLMGLPDGWVTGVPGMKRNDALRILGNGVVRQQATYALSLLLNADASGVAA